MLVVEVLRCFAQDVQESCQASLQEAEASTSNGGMLLQFVEFRLTSVTLLCTVTDNALFVCHSLSVLFRNLLKWASWPPKTVKSLTD